MNNNNNNNRRPNNQFPQTGRSQYTQRPQPNGQYQYQRTQQQYPPVRHRSRKQAKNAAGFAILAIVILVMLLVSVIIFVTRCASGNIGDGGRDTTDAVTTENSIVTDDLQTTVADIPTQTTQAPPETTEPETEALDPTYEYVTKTAADVHKGYQILVNYQNEYTFEGDFDIKPFYGNKTKAYKVKDTLVSFDMYAMSWCNKMMDAMKVDMGTGYVLVNSSYRTIDEQDSIYSMYVDKNGEEYAKQYVALPGYSEHHTGLAVDFTVYTDSGESYTFDDKPEYPEWMLANSYKYGFIQRYSKDKTDFTKIAYENWHYRYVGKPHAFYMVKNNLCLEEYIDLLRGFEFGEKHLAITDDEGVSWEIYFVPAEAATTEVPVPKYLEYEISGNNVDGFIVTCKK